MNFWKEPEAHHRKCGQKQEVFSTGEELERRIMPSVGTNAGPGVPCVPVSCRWERQTGTDAPQSLPALLPQIKYLIPAARQFSSRVNSQGSSGQNNEGLCVRELGAALPVGAGGWGPALRSRVRTACTPRGPEACANTVPSDTEARRSEGLSPRLRV